MTGNSTNPTRFQRPVAAIQGGRRERQEILSVASGGGRTHAAPRQHGAGRSTA
ncbi:MAG: GGGtGRT protein [Cloacibacillus evryensis]